MQKYRNTETEIPTNIYVDNKKVVKCGRPNIK